MTSTRLTEEDIYELDPRCTLDPAAVVLRFEDRRTIDAILAGITEDQIGRLDFHAIDRLRDRLREAGFGFGITKAQLAQQADAQRRERKLDRIYSRRRESRRPFQSLAREDHALMRTRGLLVAAI